MNIEQARRVVELVNTIDTAMTELASINMSEVSPKSNSNPSPTNEGKGTGSASHRHLNPDPARVYLIKALKSLNNEPSTCNDIMQKAITNHGLHKDTPRGSVSKALSGSDFITTRGPNRTNLYALAKYEAVATELQQAVDQQ